MCPSLMFCILVVVLRPYVAYRFLLYPLFTVLPVLFVYGLLMICHIGQAKLKSAAVPFVAVVALFVFSFNNLDARRNGFTLQLDKSSNRLVEFVRGLPAGSLLAAWPAGSHTDLIPYLTGRPLLVAYKAHYPSFKDHILNMRARMDDLVNAYLANEIQPLIDLRCRWQVDFMVVDRDHFLGKDTAPTYFAPFDERIAKIIDATDRSKMVLANPPTQTVVFEHGKYLVVDLARLSKDEDCPTRQ